MSDIISVPVPAELEDSSLDLDFDLVAYFQGVADGVLALALDTEVWEIDERAFVYEVEITDVEIEGDNVYVTYNVLFDAYYGCSDQNWAGEDERKITGSRKEGSWIFQPNTPRVRRSTLDEF